MVGWWETAKKKAIENIAATVVAGAIALVGVSAAATWGIVKTWALVPALPKSAIIAFDTACPPGWDPYKPATARVVIGAGNEHDENYKNWDRQLPSGGTMPIPLTLYPLLGKGGEEHHTLTIDQMPSHDHGGQTGESNQQFVVHQSTPAAGEFSGSVPYQSVTHHHVISAEGGGKEHNNLPPFLALNYCKRR